ncbi:hypothetical protein [Paraliomyxa miuraensis]|uniref:hypothetical protein n=1 Tax=Paraliomyxa miuraensis TaxID=376150 RepID=UPI00224E58FD|nr:hypothetical protein [Paraliomyxa miuraensis]MCX4246896.1 hypothetical protein [Paraliomyxa miuraensis]
MRTSLAIDELAAHRALSTLPDVWLDHLHGHVSADQAAAAASATEPEELVERSRVLFAPPSAEDEDRRLQALLDAHFAEPGPASSPTSMATPSRSRSRWVVASVVTMLAASLLLLVFVPRSPPAFDGGYELQLSSGYLDERAEHADPSQPRRYYEGQRITLHLRPAQAVTEPVGAVAFAVAVEDGSSHRLAIEPMINDQGVVSIVGTPQDMGLSAGRWTLVVVVGWPHHLPLRHDDVHEDREAPYDVRSDEVEIVSTDPSAP